MAEGKAIIKEDEIDLVELAKVIWHKRIFILKVSGIFLALGLLIALTSPKEYATSCILIPEAIDSEGKLGGSLGGLASLAGIDLGSIAAGNATINPGLYRSVAKSTPFLLELMNKQFYFQELEMNLSLYEYYMNYQKTSLIGKIISIPFSILKWLTPVDEITSDQEIPTGLIVISKAQQDVAEYLMKRILVTMDWELSLVTIEVEMQDPRVAGEVARFTQSYITKYVENYSVSKSLEQLRFVEEQFKQRKQDFEYAQIELATFRDENQYVNTSRAKSEEERLQSKYNLAYGIYNQLAQQVETIKLQINENTPVFTVLEPVKVPVEKSSPKTALVTIGFSLLGMIMSTILVLFKSVN